MKLPRNEKLGKINRKLRFEALRKKKSSCDLKPSERQKELRPEALGQTNKLQQPEIPKLKYGLK